MKIVKIIQHIMKHYTTSLLLTIVSILWGLSATAHALWIQSSPFAVKNKAHDVKIYYGEYASNEIESIDKWYSDVKDFKVVLITPSQRKVELPKQPFQDHFQSSFIPEEDGVYQLSIVHAAKDLGGNTKYEFSSTALVAVGENNRQELSKLPFCIEIQPKVFQQGEFVDALVLQQGNPVHKGELLVMSPEGWSKTFKTDENGKVQLPVMWPGLYVLEASVTKEEAGRWHGKDFKRTWYGTTTSIEVK